MTELWEVNYWVDNNGTSPLEKWLDERTSDQLKGIAKELALLERCGNKLRLPHSKALGQGLFELRERNFGYRLYYAFLSERRIILLQSGNKSSQKNDIKVARERLVKVG